MSRTRSKQSQSSAGKGGGQRRFAIKLMRPIFQTAVITVDAASEETAVRLALRKAGRFGAAEWSGDFEPRRYQYDVQEVIDLGRWQEEAAAEGDPETEAELIASLRSVEHIRYLLLKADIEIGQGAALNQPWLSEKSYVFLADVAGDWLADVEVLEAEGIEGYLRRNRQGNVIPFRRPVKDDDDGSG